MRAFELMGGEEVVEERRWAIGRFFSGAWSLCDAEFLRGVEIYQYRPLGESGWIGTIVLDGEDYYFSLALYNDGIRRLKLESYADHRIELLCRMGNMRIRNVYCKKV